MGEGKRSFHKTRKAALASTVFGVVYKGLGASSGDVWVRLLLVIVVLGWLTVAVFACQEALERFLPV